MINWLIDGLVGSLFVSSSLLQASNDLLTLIDNLLQYPDQALKNAHAEFNTSARYIKYRSIVRVYMPAIMIVETLVGTQTKVIEFLGT